MFVNILKGVNNKIFFDKKARKWLEKKLKTMNDTVTIHKTSGKYYLCLSLLTKKEEKTICPFKSCSIDPGVKTMLHLYSPDGVEAKLGVGLNKILRKLANKENN